MNTITQLAGTTVRAALEDGASLEEILALAGGTEPTGPSLARCHQAARRLTEKNSLPTYSIHWRRLLRGFAVPPDQVGLFLEVAEDHGLDVDTGADFPIVTDYYDDDRRTLPMAIVKPGMAEAGLLTFRLTHLHDLVAWTRVMALTFGANRTRARREEGRPDWYATGDEAIRTFRAAWNKLYEAAWADDLISHNIVNPMSRFKAPKRDPREKRTLTGEQLAQLWRVVNTDDYDPGLYSELVHFHLHYGAREEGGINLSVKDLDFTQQAIWLDEKFNKRLAIPASLDDLVRYQAFAKSRGSSQPDDPVFRQKRRRRNPSTQQLEHPRISHRTYNRLHRSIHDRLPWAANEHFGIHWLRGHAAGVVESASNQAVKKRFLRHRHRRAVDRYAPATFENLAYTLGRIYSFDHPKAQPYPGLGDRW